MEKSKLDSNCSLASLTVADLEAIVESIVDRKINQDKNYLQHTAPANNEDISKIPFDTTTRPFTEIITEISNEISAEEWAILPKDASENFNNYLYD